MSKSYAKAEIELDDLGLLDEIRAPCGQLERLDDDAFFLSFADVAVWLRAEKGRIATEVERREPGKWEETRIETLERELAEWKAALSSSQDELHKAMAALRERTEYADHLAAEVRGALVWFDSVRDELADHADVRDGEDGPKPNLYMQLQITQELGINELRRALAKQQTEEDSSQRHPNDNQERTNGL